jgi:hypothetical protein
VTDPPAGSAHEDLGPDEIAAREPLLRLARGEKIPSETLELLRTLRISTLETLLSDDEPPPPSGHEPRMRSLTVYLPGPGDGSSYSADEPPASGDLITLDGSGERVRVIAVHTDGKGGWIIYAGRLADGDDVELHGLAAELQAPEASTLARTRDARTAHRPI